VPLAYVEGFTAEPGVDVTAGGKVVGKTGTGAQGRGLAMVRLDRVADALAAGETIRAGGLPVEVLKPDWVRFEVPGASH
jgi:folate-binding Fe-S cluster repair protein YgfZ